jgi:hypothetical protein
MTLQFNPKQRLCFYVMAKQGELSGWMCIIFSWVFCVIVPAPAACTTVFVFCFYAAIIVLLFVPGRALFQVVSRRILHHRVPGEIRSKSVWDLRWIKWHWDCYLSQYVGFPLPVFFHQCSMHILVSIVDAIYSEHCTPSLSNILKHRSVCVTIWLVYGPD